MCIKLVNYEDYAEMHGQQNIKILSIATNSRNKSPCFWKRLQLKQRTLLAERQVVL